MNVPGLHGHSLVPWYFDPDTKEGIHQKSRPFESVLPPPLVPTPLFSFLRLFACSVLCTYTYYTASLGRQRQLLVNSHQHAPPPKLCHCSNDSRSSHARWLRFLLSSESFTIVIHSFTWSLSTHHFQHRTSCSLRGFWGWNVLVRQSLGFQVVRHCITFAANIDSLGATDVHRPTIARLPFLADPVTSCGTTMANTCPTGLSLCKD